MLATETLAFLVFRLVTLKPLLSLVEHFGHIVWNSLGNTRVESVD
ncbi:nitrate reductase NapE component [Bradyrhizobium sp. JR4.1]